MEIPEFVIGLFIAETCEVAVILANFLVEESGYPA